MNFVEIEDWEVLEVVDGLADWQGWTNIYAALSGLEDRYPTISEGYVQPATALSTRLVHMRKRGLVETSYPGLPTEGSMWGLTENGLAELLDAESVVGPAP